jgi:hypothetical protein
MSFPDPARSNSPLVRSYTAAEWTAANYHLLSGELGIETDSGKQKVGIGLQWSQTPYQPFPDEAPEDGIIYGRKDGEWVDLTAPANLRFNRGSAADVAAYTPLSGEPVWDETNKLLYVGDGVTQGGISAGKPVVVGALASSPTEVNSTTFSTPVTVPLAGANTVWHVIGSLTLLDTGDPIADVAAEINLAGSGSGGFPFRGVAHVSQDSGNSLHFFKEGVLELDLLNEGETFISIDYVVGLTNSATTVNWGIPIRAISAGSAGFLWNQNISSTNKYFSRLWARRII